MRSLLARSATNKMRPYEADEWQGALVAVEHGEIELESEHGVRRRFEEGDLLALQGLHLRTLRNPGQKIAVLAMSFRPARV